MASNARALNYINTMISYMRREIKNYFRLLLVCIFVNIALECAAATFPVSPPKIDSWFGPRMRDNEIIYRTLDEKWGENGDSAHLFCDEQFLCRRGIRI